MFWTCIIQNSLKSQTLRLSSSSGESLSMSFTWFFMKTSWSTLETLELVYNPLKFTLKVFSVFSGSCCNTIIYLVFIFIVWFVCRHKWLHDFISIIFLNVYSCIFYSDDFYMIYYCVTAWATKHWRHFQCNFKELYTGLSDSKVFQDIFMKNQVEDIDELPPLEEDNLELPPQDIDWKYFDKQSDFVLPSILKNFCH